jgi:hypothetical protein
LAASAARSCLIRTCWASSRWNSRRGSSSHDGAVAHPRPPPPLSMAARLLPTRRRQRRRSPAIVVAMSPAAGAAGAVWRLRGPASGSWGCSCGSSNPCHGGRLWQSSRPCSRSCAATTAAEAAAVPSIGWPRVVGRRPQGWGRRAARDAAVRLQDLSRQRLRRPRVSRQQSWSLHSPWRRRVRVPTTSVRCSVAVAVTVTRKEAMGAAATATATASQTC